MKKYFYDLHIHSCLSPCADNDMTPHNIAGMASVNGLDIVALTDHNTTKNCRAFFKAAEKYGIIPVAGMEMTTAEDIHLVCLFPTLEAAETFDMDFQKYRILYPNNQKIFGDQIIVNEHDEVVGEEEHLLINACRLSVDEAVPLLRSYGACIFPAHIDRPENGMISVLGCIPETPHFTCVEYHSADCIGDYTQRYRLEGKGVLTDSDAHYLWDISEANHFLSLEGEPTDASQIRQALIRFLNQV